MPRALPLLRWFGGRRCQFPRRMRCRSAGRFRPDAPDGEQYTMNSPGSKSVPCSPISACVLAGHALFNFYDGLDSIGHGEQFGDGLLIRSRKACHAIQRDAASHASPAASRWRGHRLSTPAATLNCRYRTTISPRSSKTARVHQQYLDAARTSCSRTFLRDTLGD